MRDCCIELWELSLVWVLFICFLFLDSKTLTFIGFLFTYSNKPLCDKEWVKEFDANMFNVLVNVTGISSKSFKTAFNG